ncbi:hypothetical protein Bca4012_095027 [Brassica carinata]|uniref:Uncharacterized protein n=6 Tax=Brassica TaxID=3705 RepID=A0A0D3DS70_BRAOL|nr:PREDICTED: uncharacterized protein LOC106310797 isoform X2 [Brassica oleracea var. oleracea]XP_013659818.1 uncharacterized protein BNAC08G23610D isoform X2 [Brassica napus]KAF3497535.1 hypothetical protein DY000_02055862 [Brassica cretica]KAG2257776.1 hypothetical protein Bca52824_077070 [Brassica carinata]VDD57147.1 unnamed protein product [Brassica oleracea]KAF3569968.1 hypothetical protein F2Q69_00061543 [Brassica cretica]KAH0864833.1 hypothetical protein HID58_082044 [Brassica napus]
MESSLGFMAVFAVSGSVVFVASQFHKRLLSDYLDKFELEIRSPDNAVIKKKVRFAADVVEPSGNNKEYRRRHSSKAKFNRELKLAATI